MGPRRGVATLWTVGALVLTLAACTGESDGGYGLPSDLTETSTAPTESTSTVEPEDEPEDEAGDEPDEPAPQGTGPDDVAAPLPFPANTDPDTQDPSADAALTVTDVRTGHHEGFDRVVLELGGTGSPGWRADYVEEPLDDGSGNRADVAGDAFLQVMVSGTGYPMDTGVEEYAGPNPVVAGGEGSGVGVVTEVLYRGVFEGYTQVFVGVDDGPRPFRVFALEDPARVVVDVRDDG